MSQAMPLVQSAILKIAGRCNINCTYCYMYNLADQTHTTQPRVMSRDTTVAAFQWIERYLAATGLDRFHVHLHGGEPLLAGREFFRFIGSQRADLEARSGKRITVSVLTNGLLLNEDWIEVFEDTGIRFGMSIDGPAEYHDRHRLTKRGQGTHQRVEEKLRWVLSSPRHRSVFSSVLCVLHPDMDGARLLRYFYDLGLDGVDFLLPDQNHVHGTPEYPRPSGVPTYGLVLADAYREWRRLDEPRFHVRKFVMLIEAIFGKVPSLDSLGTGPITVFTIETSGEVEPVDTMKACGHGFTKSGVHVRDLHSIEVNEIPLIKLGLTKRATLPGSCLSCRNREYCGGGYLPHRFSTTGFDRETVYCADMMYLCDVIREDVQAELGRSRRTPVRSEDGIPVLAV